jgi:transposase
MFLRTKTKKQNGKTYTYYQLVEAYHTPAGPRQRVIASLGDLSPRPREQWLQLIRQVESALSGQARLDEEPPGEEALDVAQRVREKRNAATGSGEWVAIDVEKVEAREARELGPQYVGVTFWERLGLDEILTSCGLSPAVSQRVKLMAVNALCGYESEHATPAWMRRTAIADLIGLGSAVPSESTLYRTLDELLPHREAIETALAERERDLFALPETLVLYDLTSTYFEGEMKRNGAAKRGYSRDKRSDCKQVVLGLILDEAGFAKGHLVFEGNRQDASTLAEMVEALDRRTGNRRAVIVMDRGLATQDNLAWLREQDRRYLAAARKDERDAWTDEFLAGEWRELHRPPPPTQPKQKRPKVEIKQAQKGDEVYILCRSEGRQAKDAAIRNRFRDRMEEALEKLQRRVEKGLLKAREKIHQAIGRLRERYPRVARFYEIEVVEVIEEAENKEKKTLPRVVWSVKEEQDEAQKLDGTYLLRTNCKDLTAETIWKTYVLLTHVESAFRSLKSVLNLRPIRHQREDRCQAHTFLCVLAYHLLHAIETTLRNNEEYRTWETIRKELSSHQVVTVALPAQSGEVYTIRKPTRAEPHHREIYDDLQMDATVSRYPCRKQKQGL